VRGRSGTRALAAVLFTDIVDSTAVASRLGDARWKELIARHHAIVRKELKRFGGKELDTAGDGFFASFGEPAAALRCACTVTESVRRLGIEVRSGVHFGECEQVGGKLGGIAVVVGARVMSLGGPGDVLVTATTKDLVAGAGFGFVDRGGHILKGVEGEWHVFVVSELDGVPRPQPVAREEAEQRLEEIQPSPSRARTWLTSRRWAVGVGVALVVALVALAVPAIRSGTGPVDIGTNSVARLRAGDGSLELAAQLGQRPGASAIGFGSLWVAQPDRGVVARVDLDDGSITDTIRVGTSPAGVAVGDSSVWVTNAGDGTVSRIDDETNEVTDTIRSVGITPAGIAFGDGALWVADSIGAKLVRIDPASGETDAVALSGQPSGVAFTANGLWVSVAPASIARVDPATESVTLIQTVGSDPTGVLSAYGSIWVANHLDGTVSRLEPATGRVEALIPVGDGPNALGDAAGSVWVANEFDGSITSIDPVTDSVERTVTVGASAASLVIDGDGVWLAVGASAEEHRGGTLTVSSPGTSTPTTLDPAFVTDSIGWQILSVTNDGLLAYRKVGGPDGASLVPDLAAGLPQVSDDGLTYRFPLRDGIHYSTGDPVRAEDFRHALERTLAGADEGWAYLYSAIDGAESCVQEPSSCDLSASVVVEEQAVTFHLATPDPDLPFKLALPPAFPVPVSTPLQDQGTAALPATGPYMISDVGADRLGLERNPRFEEWSAAAQPEAFVDAISWRFDEGLAPAFDRVVAGDLDWMAATPAPADLASLQTTHPDQTVVSQLPSTLYLGFDLRRPPFDDARVRRALNFAIDRDHVVDLLGGPANYRPTCQVLPPNVQGYEPFCPYTLGPDSGVWSAPDLDRARTLIGDADVRGQRVTVWVSDAELPGRVEAMRYVVEVMNELGLRAKLKIVHDLDTYVGAVYGGKAQAYLFGWVAGYPGAGDFIPPQFQCGSGANASGLCDDELGAAIDEAQRLQATDPADANTTWIEIEHRLVEDAVWAPLANPIQTYAISGRTQNVQVHPQWGILLSRLWVR